MGDTTQRQPERVPTWRETGRFLSREEIAALTPGQQRQYVMDSGVRDLAEIDDMPEPARTRFRALADRSRANIEARIARTEGRAAS
jgi:hypothetical protein